MLIPFDPASAQIAVGSVIAFAFYWDYRMHKKLHKEIQEIRDEVTNNNGNKVKSDKSQEAVEAE